MRLLGDLTMGWSDLIKRYSTTMINCSATSCEYHRHHGKNNCTQPEITVGRQGNCLQFRPKRINPNSGSAIREARK